MLKGLLRGFSDASSTAFKEWFQGSKVVDRAGNPLEVYHGSSRTFSVFDPENPHVYTSWNGFGSWFAKDSSYARKFMGEGGKVYEVYLSIKNPMKLRGDSDTQGFGKLVVLYHKVTGLKTFEATPESNAKFRAYLKKKGHDGVIITNFTGDTGLHPLPQDLYVVLDPAQVKSTQNVGTFDSKNPDIFHGLK